MKTPEEWMREFEAKIADAKAKAEAFQQGLEHAGATVSSDDGAITLTVAPTGALTDVKLTADAMRKSHAQLSSDIMAVARKAQRTAAVQVAETFESVNGAGSETYRMITEYLPAEDEEETAREQPGFLLEQEYDEEPEPQAPPVRPAQNRPAPPPDDEDGDFGVSIFDRK